MVTTEEIQEFLNREFSDRYMETFLDVQFVNFLFIRDLSYLKQDYLKRDPFPLAVDKPLDESAKEAIRAWAAEPFFRYAQFSAPPSFSGGVGQSMGFVRRIVKSGASNESTGRLALYGFAHLYRYQPVRGLLIWNSWDLGLPPK
jgi:hypothetical protein